MRPFECEQCGLRVPFDASSCSACGAELGYHAANRAVRELLPTAITRAYTLRDSGRLHWRCLNAAWGCNGIVTAHTSAVWCRACSLTRGRPDDHRPEPLAAWVEAEHAKRRLIHQLDELGLPITPRSREAPHGLAFDFVAIPDAAGITGHADGIVTLDLAEVDDTHRDAVRRQFGERFRSVLGHLRHEIGHYFWPVLVTAPHALAAFRELFGDERAPYAAALDAHYSHPGTEWDSERYVTAYASAHPFEDWAETFAAYLQLLELTDTAGFHGLVDDPHDQHQGEASTVDFDRAAAAWARLCPILDEMRAATGDNTTFPAAPTRHTMDKLTFVHRTVTAAAVIPSSCSSGRAMAITS
jgi:hypothetical protein